MTCDLFLTIVHVFHTKSLNFKSDKVTCLPKYIYASVLSYL